MKSIGVRLAIYSEVNLKKHYGKTRITGVLIKQAISDNRPFDLEVTDCIHKAGGLYTSIPELLKEGYTHINIRYNQGRDIVTITPPRKKV